MDRFIESELSVRHHKKSYLKSNMDRFIDCHRLSGTLNCEFKIQYG